MELQKYINNIFINIGYLLKDYLNKQPWDMKNIYIEDIPHIVEEAVLKTQKEVDNDFKM